MLDVMDGEGRSPPRAVELSFLSRCTNRTAIRGRTRPSPSRLYYTHSFVIHPLRRLRRSASRHVGQSTLATRTGDQDLHVTMERSVVRKLG